MFSFILSQKTIPDLELFHLKVKESVAEFEGFNVTNGEVSVLLSVEPTQAIVEHIENIIPPSKSTSLIIQEIVANAIGFGQKMMLEFAAENVAMGITQDGMTSTVRKNLEQVTLALMTGSLYDAIHEVKILTADKKDPKYITDTRLLIFINKIETYLGIPLSTTL